MRRQVKLLIVEFVQRYGGRSCGLSLRALRRFLEHRLDLPEHTLDSQSAAIKAFAQETFNKEATKWSGAGDSAAGPASNHHPLRRGRSVSATSLEMGWGASSSAHHNAQPLGVVGDERLGLLGGPAHTESSALAAHLAAGFGDAFGDPTGVGDAHDGHVHIRGLSHHGTGFGVPSLGLVGGSDDEDEDDDLSRGLRESDDEDSDIGHGHADDSMSTSYAQNASSSRVRLGRGPRSQHLVLHEGEEDAEEDDDDGDGDANGRMSQPFGQILSADSSRITDATVGALKKPLTAYFMFANDHRQRVKEEHPELTFGEIAKHLAHMWKTCAEPVRRVYIDKNMAHKRAYQAEKHRRQQARAIRNEANRRGRSIKAQLGGAPKKPLTAYFLFSRENRARVAQEGAAKEGRPLKFAEMSKRLSSLWRNASASERRPYIDKAEASKATYLERTRRWREEHANEIKNVKKMRLPLPGLHRPPTQFLLFSKQLRPQLRKQFPGLTLGAYSKKIGERWKAMSTEERAPFAAEAKRLFSEYQRKKQHEADAGQGRTAGKKRSQPERQGEPPTRARTAYNFFVAEIQERTRASMQEDRKRAFERNKAMAQAMGESIPPRPSKVKMKEAMRVVASRWSELGDAERLAFEAKAAADKTRFKREMEAYEERIFPDTSGEHFSAGSGASEVVADVPHPLQQHAALLADTSRPARARNFIYQSSHSLQSDASSVGDRSVRPTAGSPTIDISAQGAVVAQTHVHRNLAGPHDIV